MKKISIIAFISLFLLSVYGCSDKKKKEQPAAINETETETMPATDMSKFEDALKSLKNPQYDLLYKLIEKGVNAQLPDDTEIAYPADIKRITRTPETVTILKGATPIGIAAYFCYPKLVNTLIANGADVKAKINGMDPAAYIVQCAEAEQLGMLSNFLKAAREIEQNDKALYNDRSKYTANALIKDDINDADGKGQTLMVFAVKNDLPETIKALVFRAGGINYTNENDENYNKYPMITAAEHGKDDIFGYMLEKSGNLLVNQPLPDGSKPVILDILFYGKPDIISRVNPVPSDVLKSVINKKNPSAEKIAALAASNVNSSLAEETELENRIFPAGSASAHIAAMTGNIYVIKALALLGADLNAKDEKGDTPLIIAAKAGNSKTITALLESGADPDIRSGYNGNTPLMAALEDNEDAKTKLVAVKVLADSLSNLQIKNNQGLTAIDMAGDNPAVLKILQPKDTEHRNAYIKKFEEDMLSGDFNSKRLILKIARGGINNPLPFTIQPDDDDTLFIKGMTPLIMASVTCDDEAVKDLILLGADTEIRVKSANDTMLNAYDFADRYGVSRNIANNCANVLAMLKNPKSVKADGNLITGNGYRENTDASEHDDKHEAAARDENDENADVIFEIDEE